MTKKIFVAVFSIMFLMLAAYSIFCHHQLKRVNKLAGYMSMSMERTGYWITTGETEKALESAREATQTARWWQKEYHLGGTDGWRFFEFYLEKYDWVDSYRVKQEPARSDDKP